MLMSFGSEAPEWIAFRSSRVSSSSAVSNWEWTRRVVDIYSWRGERRAGPVWIGLVPRGRCYVRAGRAAEIEGVTLPQTRSVHGAELVLNGMGLRTHSVLQIHVYVAGLGSGRTRLFPRPRFYPRRHAGRFGREEGLIREQDRRH